MAKKGIGISCVSEIVLLHYARTCDGARQSRKTSYLWVCVIWRRLEKFQLNMCLEASMTKPKRLIWQEPCKEKEVTRNMKRRSVIWIMAFRRLERYIWRYAEIDGRFCTVGASFEEDICWGATTLGSKGCARHRCRTAKSCTESAGKERERANR